MQRMIFVGLGVVLTALSACHKSSGGDAAIGVKECDDYVKAWVDCYKDPAAKAAAKAELEAKTRAWREQAKEPTSRAALIRSCKMALDDFQRSACH